MAKSKFVLTTAVFLLFAALLLPAGAASQEGSDDSSRGLEDPGDAPPASGDVGTNDRDGNPEDFVIADDLIVDGSACIGLDCVNGESFGFDTLRLKENNTRIRFFDTSSSASFPTRDWQITANDSANGGLNKFSIDDIDGGRTPFTIEADARTHALYVKSNGRIGIGTNNPVTDLHVKQGNTPTLRLEQDGSSGFTAQTWDVAGNEAGFFIRDASNGSTLPLRIRPGAPSSAIDVANGGDVGIGAAPTRTASELEISDSDGSSLALCSTAIAGVGGCWEYGQNASNSYFASLGGTGGSEFVVTATGRVQMGPGATNNFDLLTNGNLTILGMLTQNSDRESKTEFAGLDAAAVLDALNSLEIVEWEYKDAPDERHIGPMAQDFYAAFGLGATDTGIASLDVAGVTLLGVQALSQQVTDLQARNDSLEARIAALEALLVGVPE